MDTSILTFVLAGMMIAAQNAPPAWQANYLKAQKQSAAEKKPLLVVFGPASLGWAKMVRGGGASAEFAQLLAANYVCVHADTAFPAGKKLARDFAISGNSGMVISDRTGTKQAFWHQGEMTVTDLARILRKYADPGTAVITTETTTSTRISNYAPIYQIVPAAPTSPARNC